MDACWGGGGGDKCALIREPVLGDSFWYRLLWSTLLSLQIEGAELELCEWGGKSLDEFCLPPLGDLGRCRESLL